MAASDFAHSLSSPALAWNADGSPSFEAFGLAAASQLLNAGSVPAGELPFDAAGYYVGAPDLGAVEKR